MFCTTSSIVFMGKCSHLIALFNSLGSMQILSILSVSTMTMPVGSSCFLITPSFSILWSSSLTRSWSANGIFLRECTTGGTLGLSLILYSPGRQPNPLNESAYSSVISTPTEQSLSMSPSLWHASAPRIAVLSISVTKNWTLCSTFLQTHVRFVVPSVLMWCPEHDVSLALDFVIFLSLTQLSVLNTLCEMILHNILAPVSSWKFTLTPSTSMVLYQQPVFTALMSFWFIVPTKYSVSELSESSTVFTLCLQCERLVTFFFVLHIFSKWFFALHFWQTSPIAGQGASPCCLPHLPHVCLAAWDFESLCLQFFFFTACTPCSVSSVISLSCWTETSSTLATSMALSRVKSKPTSMSFSRALADFVPNTILSHTMSTSACPYSQSFTSSFNAVTNCWTVSPGSWILLCSLYLAKIGFDLQVVRRPGTYHSILAELSVVHQSCPMWRIFFFLSHLPTASNNSIALLHSSP